MGAKIFAVNCIRLCFRRRSAEQYEGEICGVALENAVEFHGAADLIFKIDDAFNRIGHPQPHQILRTFGESGTRCAFHGNPTRYCSNEEIDEQRGEEGTYDLLMITRHSSEWQGILRNLDDGEFTRFKTTLECMKALECN